MVEAKNISPIYVNESGKIIEEAETDMRDTMRQFYGFCSTVPTDELPKGLIRVSDQGLIVDTGDPRRPATILKPDGHLEAIQFGISSNPNEFDFPITGLRYLQKAQEILTKVTEKWVASSKNRQ